MVPESPRVCASRYVTPATTTPEETQKGRYRGGRRPRSSRADVFYDIGANVGFFTLVASRVVGPTGRLHAFEPRWAIVRALRSNLRRNRLENAHVWPFAVGDEAGEVILLCSDHPGGATIEPTEALAVTNGNEFGS